MQQTESVNIFNSPSLVHGCNLVVVATTAPIVSARAINLWNTISHSVDETGSGKYFLMVWQIVKIFFGNLDGDDDG